MNGKSKESEPPAQSPAMVPAEGGPRPPGEPPLSDTESVPRRRPIPRNRVWIARIVAIAADAVQLALLPLVIGGAISPVADVIDVFVAIVLTWLVGWHWAFLPTFIAELVPVVDLVPSWTLAAFIATRDRGDAAPRRDKTATRQP